MLLEPPAILPLYKICLKTLVNNTVFLYPKASGGFACYRQEFGLNKTSHGLDDAVLDLLFKHLTLLRLLLDVDLLSGKPGLSCVPLTYALALLGGRA